MVDSLSNEYDVVAGRDGGGEALSPGDGRRREEQDERPPCRPAATPPHREERDVRDPDAARRRRHDRIFIGAGREAGIRPQDLVGAIANEAGVAGSLIGAIQITDRFSLVEVPEEVADQVIKALGKSTIRGKKVQVRRDKANY